jgi:iron-sulfur cluster repair protein YtfE (RIC family)
MHTCHIPEPAPERAAELARLRFLARKVALVHGTSHPRMQELAAVVGAVADHPEQPTAAGTRERLAVLTDRFQPWPEACGSVRALFSGLAAL